MITLDQYKQLLALTNSQFEQARHFIRMLTEKGILFVSESNMPAPKRLLLDSEESYQSRQTMYNAFRFSHATESYNLDYQIASLLCELHITAENTQEVYNLVEQLMIETKPFVVQHYQSLGITESSSLDFNLVLLWTIRTANNGWAIPLALYPDFSSPDENLFELPLTPVPDVTDSVLAESEGWHSIRQLQEQIRVEQNGDTEIYRSLKLTNNPDEQSDILDEIYPIETVDSEEVNQRQRDLFFEMFKQHGMPDSATAKLTELSPSDTNHQA